MSGDPDMMPLAGDIETGQLSAGGDGGEGAAGTTIPVELPPEPTEYPPFMKPLPETTPMERLTGGVAGAAVATSLAAIVVEQSAVVFVGGVLSAIVGPYAYYQQTKLTDIKALQATHRAIREQVDILESENKRLANTIDDMTGTVNKLEDVEGALEVITQTQGQSVQAFKEQVEESKKILKKMQSNHKATVLQNLLTLVLTSDTDKDMMIDESEIDSLIRRLNNLSGVTVHEERFRAAIAGKSVSAVMDIVKNLLDDDTPDEEKIFDIIND